MWLHGGYTTFFPYISSDGAGSDYGTTALGRGGFRPYPDYPYFLSDMWFFNTSSGQWSEITATSPTQPTPRMNHVMIMVDHILVVFGGFYFNHHYDDTWFFNTTTRRGRGGERGRERQSEMTDRDYWLEKTSHVHAVYPANCTDDLLYIEENNCTELLWPNDLERDQDSPWDALPYAEQANYYPDGEFARYYGVHAKGDIGSREALFSVGSPLPPYMATAPRQHVRRYVHAFNDTHSAVLYEWCTSVLGEPTRDTTLDGLFGRSDSPVFVPQPRRQAPGWDGCRDREDGRTDLDQGLMWEHPGHRSDAQAVYSKKHAMVLMYGGQGYSDWQTPSVNITTATSVLSDFWVLGMSECASNCSFHGDCSYGSCSCHDGFFGLDCSNASCPGDFCYYEETTHVEVCSHCCQAGWSHQDGDTYVTEDVSRSECSLTSPGESHGICDGFGTCQCAPPFIGDDCSIKDCQYNCSFNGWCSVEFPVSRCMCTPGYYGEYCQYLECLNNCSYPHGTCDSSTGVCACEMTYSPYNNTRPWYAWMGEDCSFLVAFAAAPRSSRAPSMLAAWLLPLAVSVTLVMMMDGIGGGNGATFGAGGTAALASGSQACPDGAANTTNGIQGISEASRGSEGRKTHVSRSATSVTGDKSSSSYDWSGRVTSTATAVAAARRPSRITNTAAVAETRTPSSSRKTVAATATTVAAEPTRAGGGSSAHCTAERRWEKTTRRFKARRRERPRPASEVVVVVQNVLLRDMARKPERNVARNIARNVSTAGVSGGGFIASLR
ncbi:unnamed protein product [Ectocarpus sp. 6 AP-2014]